MGCRVYVHTKLYNYFVQSVLHVLYEKPVKLIKKYVSLRDFNLIYAGGSITGGILLNSFKKWTGSKFEREQTLPNPVMDHCAQKVNETHIVFTGGAGYCNQSINTSAL